MIQRNLEKLKHVGYFVLKNAIDMKTIETLQNDFEKVMRLENPAVKNNYFYLAHTLSENFYSFLETNPAQFYIDTILGETCIIHSYNGITLKPQVDNPIQNKIHRDTQRFCRPYLLSVQQIIVLDDFTKENGATYILPKSHLKSEKPSDEYFFKNAVQIEAKKGDILVFDSLCWHCGGINLTSQQRRALTIVYTRSFMKQQINLPSSINREVKNSKIRRLLGFDVRVPSNMKEFDLPVNERLYKPNQG